MSDGLHMGAAASDTILSSLCFCLASKTVCGGKVSFASCVARCTCSPRSCCLSVSPVVWLSHLAGWLAVSGWLAVCLTCLSGSVSVWLAVSPGWLSVSPGWLFVSLSLSVCLSVCLSHLAVCCLTHASSLVHCAACTAALVVVPHFLPACTA